jgi:hypothetical protein
VRTIERVIEKYALIHAQLIDRAEEEHYVMRKNIEQFVNVRLDLQEIQNQYVHHHRIQQLDADRIAIVHCPNHVSMKSVSIHATVVKMLTV